MSDRKRLPARIAGTVITALVLVGAIASWLALSFHSGVAPEPLRVVADGGDEEFGRRVRNYILTNPDVVLDALQLIEKREQTTASDETKISIAARRKELLDDPTSPVGGSPTGDVTIVEFFDYNCPYCRGVAPVFVEAEKADPQLRFVYKEWPILGANSVFAARAALAAVRQGKYLAFHKAMMTTPGAVNESKVIEVATAVGLDAERLKKDMEDPEISATLERNHALAAGLRANGTPSFVIGDQLLSGAVDLNALQALVRAAREKR